MFLYGGSTLLYLKAAAFLCKLYFLIFTIKTTMIISHSFFLNLNNYGTREPLECGMTTNANVEKRDVNQDVVYCQWKY